MAKEVFNAAAFFICFREAIEACLIVGIMLAYTKRTGNQRYNRYIWSGTVVALICSIAIGIGFAIPYWIGKDEVFAGKAQYIFEGVLSLFASGLLTWMIIWTTTMGREFSAHVEKSIEGAIESGMTWKMFMIPFIQILREGIEAVIFIFGVGNAGSWTGIPLPGVIGIAIAVVCSYLLFKGAINVDLIKLLQICSYVLMFFAAGLGTYGLHELQEANWFGRYKNYGYLPALSDTDSVADPLKGWTGQTLWSTKSFIHDTDNEFGALVRALVGYQDTPTFMELYFYFLYFIIVFGILHWQALKSGLTNKKVVDTIGNWGKGLCALAAFWGFLQFIWACSVDWHPWAGFVVSLLSMGLFSLGYYAQSRLSGTNFAKRSALALYYLVGAAVFHVFTFIVIVTQLNGAAKCVSLDDLKSGIEKGYKGYESDIMSNHTYQDITATVGTLSAAGKSTKGVSVTLHGEVCDVRQYGNSFAHQLFVLNTDYIRGVRSNNAWTGGATLVVALIFNAFSACWHVTSAFHLWKYYGQVAAGTADAPADSPEDELPRYTKGSSENSERI